MADKGHLQVLVINPDDVVFDGEAEYVLAPTTKGTVGILPGHTPLFAEVTQGEIIISHASGEDEKFSVDSGILKVRADTVTILIGLE